MSVAHMALVFAAEGLNGSETLLLLGYTNYTDQHGYCWPSEKRLADDCGISVSTVARTKRALAVRSLVKSVRRVNPKTGEPISNLTRVNLPLLASMKRKSKHYDDDLIGEITFDDDQDARPDGAEEEAPDLLTCQSDSYPPSDCQVPPGDMTGTPCQYDSQSTSDPSVDPSVIPNAPAARSASDARRASTGSTRAREGGSAASGKSKLPPLTREQRQTVQAVRNLLPDDLNSALSERMPRNISDDVLRALAAGQPRERTVEQLVEYRVLPRWGRHWAGKFYAGELTPSLPSGKPKQPFGPLSQMLADTAECGNLSCEDRHDFVTGAACRACEMRKEDHRREKVNERAQARPEAVQAGVPTPRATPVVGAPRGKCAGCFISILVVGPAVEDGLCRECRSDQLVRTEGAYA